MYEHVKESIVMAESLRRVSKWQNLTDIINDASCQSIKLMNIDRVLTDMIGLFVRTPLSCRTLTRSHSSTTPRLFALDHITLVSVHLWIDQRRRQWDKLRTQVQSARKLRNKQINAKIVFKR